MNKKEIKEEEYFKPFEEFANATLKLELIASNLISKAFWTETSTSRQNKNQKELDKIAFNYYKLTKNIPYYSKSKWFPEIIDIHKNNFQEYKTKIDLDKQHKTMKEDCKKGYEKLCLIEDKVKEKVKSYIQSKHCKKDMYSLYNTYIKTNHEIEDVYEEVAKHYYMYKQNFNEGYFHTTEETIKPHEQKR